MAKLTFLGLAEKILREENKPLSPSEIWKTAVAGGYDKDLESGGKTPAATLYSAIFTNTRDHPETIFVKLGQRPARYFLKDLLPGKEKEIEKAIAASDDTAPLAFEYKKQIYILLLPTIHASTLRRLPRLFVIAPQQRRNLVSGSIPT
jgi:hypothetical protein